PQQRANRAVGRGNGGIFAKGNKLSVGNKSHVNQPARDLKQALIDAISKKDIRLIADALVEKAKAGDIPAVKELFDRMWGRAAQSVEVSGADGEPIPVTIVDFKGIDDSK
ncbi:hypothetical protein LCGC14_2689890, partial [marine sediment metagenome]